MKKIKKIFFKTLFVLAVLYGVLLIPLPEKRDKLIANKPAFVWNSDSLWLSLEKDFSFAKKLDSFQLDSIILGYQKSLSEQINFLQTHQPNYNDSIYNSIEKNVFSASPYVAARPQYSIWFVDTYNQLRSIIKTQSQQWPLQTINTKNTLYRLLYGMRAATEEVVLQADSNYIPAAMLVSKEHSATPAANILGITVHSGDILVSRGGAEVSALISRGNDYPGNFSHIAFLYVDEKTKEPYLIESHIEKGVAIANVEQYIKDRKLRFMVMRPRFDLISIQADSLLPHKAAKAMFEESFSRHIAYDFKMDYEDSVKMFCSEVAYYAYRKQGIELWKQLSTISSNGIVNWLHQFGVDNFITQMPSDVEYDPQLTVVAEWRDPETLYKDHIDNAVMDAMLEQANAGQQVGYNIWQLPLVRLIKAWCFIKNQLGYEGIIPEGMSATTALKNQWLVNRNRQITTEVKAKADGFIKEHQYKPPYWQLLNMAQKAALE